MKDIYKRILSVMFMLGVLGLLMNAGISMNTYMEDAGYQPFKTAAATDTIKFTIPPKSGKRAVITGGQAIVGATAHKAWFINPVSQTTLAKAMGASAVACTLTDSTPDYSGGVPAAADIYVIEKNDGSYQTVTCSVYANTKSIQFKNAEKVTVQSSSGKRVWAMGRVGDGNGQYYQMSVSSVNNLPAENIFGQTNKPIVVRLPCVTNVDTLSYASWVYINK